VRIGPVLLLPLFYRVKPLEREVLRVRLIGLARTAGTPVLGAYEWRLGDRTRKANAALAGLGRTRRILLSDTLLAEYSDDEIEVILAHELAHHLHRDVWIGLGYDTALTCAGFYVAHRALQAAAPTLALQGTADVAGAPVLLLAVGALTLLLTPLANALSRAHERRADRTALRLTNNPGAFISAMRRLGQQNLAEESPSRLVQALFYTHPPIKERLRAARDWPAAIAS
jgi:STE24 endopeptidase